MTTESSKRSENRIRRHTILQFMCDLSSGKHEENASKAKLEILKWTKNRVPTLPNAAWEFEAFEWPHAAPSAEVATLETSEINYWILRLDDPDKNVPGRIWTTEASIVKTPKQLMLGLRSQVSTREEELDITPAVPGLVLQLSDTIGIYSRQRQLKPTAHHIKDEADFDGLLALIEDPHRKRPVFVISENEVDNTASIDANQLARKSIGLAHVVTIPASLTYKLTDEFGKGLSVFGGAIRTYNKGFDRYTSSSFHHPLAMPESIENWQRVGRDAFVDFLVARSARQSSYNIEGDANIPSFQYIRQQSLQLEQKARREFGRHDVKWQNLIEQENKQLKKALNEKDQELEEVWELASEAQIAEEDVKRERFYLRDRVRELEQLLAVSGAKVEIPIPTTLAEAKDWCEKYFAGRLLFTPKAARAAKNSVFENIDLAYRALMVMGQEYFEMKTSHEKSLLPQFNKKLTELGLVLTPSGEESRLKERGDEFFVAHNGQRRLLDLHIKDKSSPKDPTRCFRLYFFWDDETQQAVIGSLPGHLRTRQS
ncbi:hypothetical protein [Kordiimonas sp.]|uniref:hypothetical protein n=1 Tax=Kordiimonas sp. TaxID=1970157 RepID=UPI003A939446